MRRLWLLLLVGMAWVIPTTTQAAAALQARSMWIWELPRSEGGSLTAIASKAQRYQIETLIIKGGDGGRPWRQLSRGTIKTLRQQGLKICAWQYLYGHHPRREAEVTRILLRRGIRCLVLDIESEYDGRFASAAIYRDALAGRLDKIELAVSSWAWPQLHPRTPLSLFLTDGLAELVMPQLYWREIGTSTQRVWQRALTAWPLYQRPLQGIGQLYNRPPRSQVLAFRAQARALGQSDSSWWDWQEARPRDFAAIASASLPTVTRPEPEPFYLVRGSSGDLVLWAQMHLRQFGYRLRLDGCFGRRTYAAVRQFQRDHDLPSTGQIGPLTWPLLLRRAVPPLSLRQARAVRLCRPRPDRGQKHKR